MCVALDWPARPSTHFHESLDAIASVVLLYKVQCVICEMPIWCDIPLRPSTEAFCVCLGPEFLRKCVPASYEQSKKQDICRHVHLTYRSNTAGQNMTGC